MVISEEHRYCFVEYPRSASFAIRNELVEHYGGKSWLNKHSRYKDFAKSLPETYRDYFVFCSIRNPMTDIISVYNINRTNASGRATPEFWSDWKWFIKKRELRRADFFQKNQDTSFPNFFRKIFILPYIKPRIVAELHEVQFDHIIRVESLQEDFAAILQKLGLRQVRPVGQVNVSSGGKIDLDEYYPKEIRKHAVWVLGPMVKFMGYDFPKQWQVSKIPMSSEMYFRAMKPLCKFFLNHVKYRKQ